MKSSAKKVELAPYDDLFSTEESRQDAKLEKVREIPLSELHPFKNHPFKVKDDEAMMETADSVRQYGVLVPAIARPDPEGGYELVAGHRRHRASELAEKETMPVIVRDLDDDAATIIMVDSNLQRESLLPSERAFAYRMKLEAIKHQGERSDLTSRQVGEKSQTSIQKVADQAGESQRQVQRYIRLTELIPELMDMVDEKKIALNPAYELSFLKKEEQVDLLDAMDSEQATPSLSQAQRLKKFSQEGHLSIDVMRAIMQWVLLTEEDYVTTNWSGGTTTLLAIAPQESVYANRDFLWRFSSAKVILEHSDFTPLPDYNRLIATVKGGLDMKVGDGARFSLAPYQIYSFDGAVSVESWGCCTDFNLMLRKGQCQGTLQALTLSAGSAVSWTAPVSAPEPFPRRTLAVYCGQGQVSLPEDHKTASAGQFLLCREAEDKPVCLESSQGAQLITAVIYSR